MDPNKPRIRRVPRLYCSQPTQTQPETQSSDHEAESSDFPPFRIGKMMSPASAMRRNEHQPSLSNEEEPPQSRRRQQGNTGLGKTNMVNVVDASHATVATAPVQPKHGKVIANLLCTLW